MSFSNRRFYRFVVSHAVFTTDKQRTFFDRGAHGFHRAQLFIILFTDSRCTYYFAYIYPRTKQQPSRLFVNTIQINNNKNVYMCNIFIAMFYHNWSAAIDIRRITRIGLPPAKSIFNNRRFSHLGTRSKEIVHYVTYYY